jgi:redox-sensitive bicupin YhaK (pirin superfamily)
VDFPDQTNQPETSRPGPSSARSATAVASLHFGSAAPGFIQGTIGAAGDVPLDPFVSITEFLMSEPIFAPHPHAGFSAVTYMFSDSEGAFVNRDSLGDRSLIGAGSLHWTQAASGMMHEEVPEVRGVASHGMQLFVNLRAADKELAPRAFHLDAGDVPVVSRDGVTVRVVLGEYAGAASPLVGLAEPVGLLEVELAPDAELSIPVAPDDRVVLLVASGGVVVAGTAIDAHHVATLDGPGRHAVLIAGGEGAVLLVLTGRPMNEPVVFGGSFVALDRADIDVLQTRFRRGEMGTLTATYPNG